MRKLKLPKKQEESSGIYNRQLAVTGSSYSLASFNHAPRPTADERQIQVVRMVQGLAVESNRGAKNRASLTRSTARLVVEPLVTKKAVD
jgi:hypothetical protein